jgi:hypothetical protein
MLLTLFQFNLTKMVYEGTVSVIEFAKSKTNHYLNINEIEWLNLPSPKVIITLIDKKKEGVSRSH